jgi:lysophospholipase L1-like esterase
MSSHKQLSRLAAGLLACVLAPALASAEEHCKAPNEMVRLTQPLVHTGKVLSSYEPLTVVAIGSSSTAGAGASSPAASYPSRLAVELHQQLPAHALTVINRGINGEEVRDMLARFDDGVIAEKPDLVLWQLGTNSVLRDHPIAPTNTLILEGVRRLREIGADVVMIDPQFAPRVIAKPEAEDMVKLISATAKEANVDLFQRFAVMRYWHDGEHMPFSDFISPDEIHMNDWSYACLAKLLGASITEAATRGVAWAQARPPVHVTP